MGIRDNFIIPRSVITNAIVNKGFQYIQHGNNVITLANAQSSTSYIATAVIRMAASGGVTTRGPWHNTNPMTVSTYVDLNDTNNLTRLKVRLHGGFGYNVCGVTGGGTFTGIIDRYDDIANSQTTRTAISPGREYPAAFSLNGYGVVSCGATAAGQVSTGDSQRFDDIANAWTARTAGTSRDGPGGYTIAGLGFTSGGFAGGVTVKTTERFNDVTNAWTARANLNTAVWQGGGFGLNNFGFIAGGSGGSGAAQKLDDTANTQTNRATLITNKFAFQGFVLNGFGFALGGSNGLALTDAERFDDVANAWASRTALGTAESDLNGFSLNGFGFINGGKISGVPTATAQRFDDIANAYTTLTSLSTARTSLGGLATNEYFVNFMTTN